MGPSCTFSASTIPCLKVFAILYPRRYRELAARGRPLAPHDAAILDLLDQTMDDGDLAIYITYPELSNWCYAGPTQIAVPAVGSWSPHNSPRSLIAYLTLKFMHNYKCEEAKLKIPLVPVFLYCSCAKVHRGRELCGKDYHRRRGFIKFPFGYHKGHLPSCVPERHATQSSSRLHWVRLCRMYWVKRSNVEPFSCHDHQMKFILDNRASCFPAEASVFVYCVYEDRPKVWRMYEQWDKLHGITFQNIANTLQKEIGVTRSR